MSRLLAALITSVLLTATVHAQEPVGFTPEEQEGTYFGSGEGGELTVELTHRRDDVFAVKIDTVVPMESDFPGCAGGIEGEMILGPTGGNLLIENEDYKPASGSPMTSEQYCEVKLVFDEDGFLNLEEQRGCLAYHGAACEFTGQVMNSRAAG
ncbi:hypothetical protein ACI3KW_00170 [Devosia sp. ZW T5_3]|uniref:hypothetical protein n=1 Tax=Devosia sp. ZW T5_3 TaxID=3378085 RepID=UPI00385519DC